MNINTVIPNPKNIVHKAVNRNTNGNPCPFKPSKIKHHMQRHGFILVSGYGRTVVVSPSI